MGIMATPGAAQRSVSGLPIDSTLLSEPWPAQWVASPEADVEAYGVYHFRRTITLDAAPDSFVVHTSADNRYQLFVNGERVRTGPARREVSNWRFETTDLAPHLEVGSNVLAAVVWNFGAHWPVAQFSHRTGFLLQAKGEAHAALNTDDAWRVTENKAYAPVSREEHAIDGYLVVGPGERVDADRYPWGWRTRDYNDSGWAPARELGPGMPKEGPGPTGLYEAWKLVPRTFPRMESRIERFGATDRARGVEVEPGVLTGEEDLVIPANTEAALLLDKDSLTAAYPVLRMSGGDGSRVQITYAEALYDEDGLKGDRDEIAGKTIRGIGRAHV